MAWFADEVGIVIVVVGVGVVVVVGRTEIININIIWVLPSG